MNTTQNGIPTALVIKPITRCPSGYTAQGYIAVNFDRVGVLETKTFSCGNRSHKCRTASGEIFFANDSMVQLDGVGILMSKESGATWQE